MEFYCPTKIVTGRDALEVLRTLTASRVLVVTDKFFSQKARELGEMIPGAQVQVFDEVTPDPSTELAAKGGALCSRFRPDLLIALGGGSPMDCAKAIRLAYGEVRLIAIPTTSGSGSEVTAFSVLTHEGVKHPVVDASIRPHMAILDDCLLRSLPPKLAADTGMDLLAHCVEAAAATGRTSFSDALAFHGTAAALELLESSFRGDTAVRGLLHEAACMAGMAFDNAGLGLCHAMAHGLGGAYHVPHGRLCGILLPAVMEVNKTALPQYARLAGACGLGAPTQRLGLQNLIRAIVRLRSALGLPATLREAGIDLPEQPQTLIAAILRDGCCKTNPVPVTEELVQTVLRKVRR